MASLKSLVGLPSTVGISMKFIDDDGFQMVVYPNTMRKLKKFIRTGKFNKYHQLLIAMNPEKCIPSIKLYDNRVFHALPPIYTTLDGEDVFDDEIIIGKATSVGMRRVIMDLNENVDLSYEKSD